MVLFRRDEGARGAYRQVARAGLICAALLLGAQASGHAEENGPAQKANAQKSAPNPVTASLSASPPSKNSPPRCPHDTPREQASADCREAIATEDAANYSFGSLVVGGVQALLLFGQIIALIATIRQTRTAVKASQRSAKAAKQAVKKSDEMLVHAQASSQKELRAYVFLESAELQITGGKGTVCLKFTNAGQTPAYGAKIHGKIAKVFIPIPDEMPVYTGEPELSDEPIGPRMNRFKYETVDLSQHEIAALNSGDRALVVWGIVEYRDAFQAARRTHYRYFAGGPIGLRTLTDRDGHLLAIGMSAHKYGNSAD